MARDWWNNPAPGDFDKAEKFLYGDEQNLTHEDAEEEFGLEPEF